MGRSQLAVKLPVGLLLVLLAAGCARTVDVVPITEGWQYRLGFEEHWLEGKDAGDWKDLRFKGRLVQQIPELKGMREPVTYRTKLPQSIRELLRSGTPVAFFSGRLGDVCRFYLGRTLIGQQGQSDPYVPGYYRHTLASLPNAAYAGEPQYLYTVITAPQFLGHEISGPLRLGPAEQVYWQYFGALIIDLVLNGIYLVVGLYHLLLAFRRRKELHNLYFGMFAVQLAIYWFIRTNLREQIFADTVTRARVEYTAAYMITPWLLLFLSQFFHQRNSRLGIGMMLFSIVLALLTAVGPYSLMQHCLLAWQLSTALFMFYAIFFIVREVFRKNRDAYYLVVGITILMAAGFHDILTARGVLTTPHIGNYAFLVLVLGIAGVLANRFVRVHNQVEELNKNLEQKVEERTHQLKESLGRVQALKEQQDGDYFLTSLLIQPLAGNSANSQNVHVEVLERQKKRFSFRGRDVTIGGDICIADTLNLHGRSYTVFLNGDAMGKSIQGAGGALVLGTVFRSLVARTQLSAGAQRRYPEQWLKDCFLELQNVFVTFDGSMLVSIVAGLVDEETGMAYFLNAEHPWVVLYRDGRATYIESELSLRKIGISGLEGSLSLQTFAMQPNDVLIVGSDGRDDLLVGTDADGQRLFNEDEQLFLRMVERGGGLLREIEATILESAELTDDFSLLRIGFKEDFPIEEQRGEPAYEQHLAEARRQVREGDLAGAIPEYRAALAIVPDAIEPLRELARALLRSRQYEEAVECCRRCTELIAADEDFLHMTALSLKHVGRFAEAADFGERLRLRNPAHVRNLINLGDVYRLLGQLPRARSMLERARSLGPESGGVRKLEQMLEASGDSPLSGVTQPPA